MKKLNYFLDKVSFKKVLSVSILVLIFTLLIFGFRAYSGNKLIYLLFTTVSTFSLFYGFREKSIFFDNFIAILLWLGFWFKFTIQISFSILKENHIFLKAQNILYFGVNKQLI